MQQVSRRRKIFRFVKVFLLFYSIIGIAIYYMQDKMLFHPENINTDYHYKFNVPFEEVNIPFNSTDTMNMVKFFPADSLRKGVVIYFHGNMKNVERYAPFAKTFTENGYEVWMPDYPGFGKSTGEFTETKLYEQALQVYRMAAGHYQKDSIIIYGKSLGTGIAAYVAYRQPNKALVLETPYYDIPSIVGAYAFIYPTERMIKFKIPTWQYLQQVKSPVTILVGTSDGVIRNSVSAKLKKFLKPDDKYIEVKGAGHNEVNISERYKNVMDSLLSN
ncbi:MAG: alpha/beta fold hydrolase [Ferruginibacter sp.]